jgi:predicted nuclease of predicted toxin-antitoxin system
MSTPALRFKTDEKVHPDVAQTLRSAGFDAMTAREQSLRGRSDDNIGAICRTEGRTLITHDLDFADIRNFAPADHPGIIVLRLDSQNRLSVLAALGRVLPLLSTEPLHAHLWIVEDHRIRIRTGDA